MDINQASLQMHYDLHGKIEVISRKKIETREDLSLAYTPGVAEPCRVIPVGVARDAPLAAFQPGSCYHRRNCSFRSWRYWSCCRYAGYGRKMRPV